MAHFISITILQFKWAVLLGQLVHPVVSRGGRLELSFEWGWLADWWVPGPSATQLVPPSMSLVTSRRLAQASSHGDLNTVLLKGNTRKGWGQGKLVPMAVV